MGLLKNASETGAYLRQAFTTAIGDHPNLGEIRGEGLLCAVEFVEDRETRKFFDPAAKIGARVTGALFAEGVIARAMPEGDIVGFAPPLCLTRDEADRIADALARAVATTFE